MSKGKIKILFAINCMNIGGAPSVVFNQMKYIDTERFEPHLLLLYPSKPANFLSQMRFLPEGRIKQFHLRNRSIFDWRTLLSIRNYLRKERFDVVYTHLYLANFLVRAIAVMVGVPMIAIFEHSAYANKSRWQIAMDRLLAKFTDAIFTSTEEVARFTAHQERLPSELFRVVRNPVSIPLREDVDIEELWKMIGGESHPLFLTIGRFSEEKGQHVLIDAAERAHKDAPHAKFLLVGHGPLEERLKHQIEAKGAGEYITLLHAPERAKEYLHIADWFVLPSLREGQAMVVEEAMLAGAPVIASELPGMGNIVRDDVNGYRVPRGDVGALAAKIVHAATHPADTARLSEGAETIGEEHFAPEARVEEFTRILLTIAEEKQLHNSAVAA